MSSEDGSDHLNMESFDFAHQDEEGLWDQKQESPELSSPT